MLVVKIELWPHGDESRKQLLGTAEIVNDGTGSDGSGNSSVGHYAVRIFQRGKTRKLWRKGVVRHFPRRRLGPWDLLFRALFNVVGERNPETVESGPQREE